MEMTNFQSPVDLKTEGAKKAMGENGARRGEFWRVPIDKLNVMEGFNAREDSQEYRDHIQSLKNLMLQEKSNGSKSGWKDSHPAEVVVVEGKIYLSNAHSRYAAALLANKEDPECVVDIPCVPRPGQTTMEELTIGLYTTNSGKPLTTLGMAVVVTRLKDQFNKTDEEIASRLSITTKYVGHLLLLGRANPKIHQLIADGKISASQVIQKLLANPKADISEELEGQVEEAEKQGKKKVTAKTTKTPEQKASAERKKHADEMFDLVTQLVDANPPVEMPEELREKIEGILFRVEKVMGD